MRRRDEKKVAQVSAGALAMAWDCLKLLFDWNKPADQEWSEFVMEKVGALVLFLVLIGIVAVVIVALMAKEGL